MRSQAKPYFHSRNTFFKHIFNQKRVLREWRFEFGRSSAERYSTECNSVQRSSDERYSSECNSVQGSSDERSSTEYFISSQ